MNKLNELLAEKFPKAYKPLQDNRYVDDILAGNDTEDGQDEQIHAVEEVMKRGGFSLKFVVKSGENPPEKASSEGERLKILGFKWDSDPDILSPGLGELCLSKKMRGEKKPNLKPVLTVHGAEDLLEKIQ